MSYTHDTSWTPSEKVDLLVNVLQNAFPDLPSFLYQIILDHHLYPKWNDIALPKGRSLNSSQMAYDEMSRLYRQPGGRPQQPPPHLQSQPLMPPQIQLQYPQPAAPPLRPYVEPDPFYGQQRILQPRPPRSTDSPAPTVTNGETPILQRQLPLDAYQEPRRKRGRPSKEEAEERDRALALEGRVYLPKKRANKKPRASTAAPGSEGIVATSPSATSQAPQSQSIVPKVEDVSNQEVTRQREEDIPTGSNGDTEQDGAEQIEAQADLSQSSVQSPSDRLLASHRERERDRDRDGSQTTSAAVQAIPRSTPQSEPPSQYASYERSIPLTSDDQR